LCKKKERLFNFPRKKTHGVIEKKRATIADHLSRVTVLGGEKAISREYQGGRGKSIVFVEVIGRR